MQLFIAYYRVSTPRQGRSGLGLQAQKTAVSEFMRNFKCKLLMQFVEVESGKHWKNRGKLLHALELCQRHGATLLIARLDRLARNVLFIATLIESGIQFIAVDKPNADKYELLDTAVKDERERYYISKRTKEALAEAKKKGVKLGSHAHKRRGTNRKNADKYALEVLPHLKAIQSEGITTHRGIADALNRRKVKTFYGGSSKWHKTSVCNLVYRLRRLTRNSRSKRKPISK